MGKSKQKKEHWEEVQELRRSNAAGIHGSTRYKRKAKYKPDYTKDNDE